MPCKTVCVLRTGFLIAMSAILLGLPGCVSSSGARERAIPLSVSVSEHDASWGQASQFLAANALPKEQEVRDAVQRVFAEDVRLVGGHGGFVAGDFNGDDAQDLAVEVVPSQAKLAELNDCLANWIIQDPRHAYVPPKARSVVVPPTIPKPQKIQAGERLLVVIHGYGPRGWRDPMARQAYLLRGAAGTSMRVTEPSDLLMHDFGALPSRRDVIAEKLGQAAGVIYWTGATYAWHAER